MICICCVLNSVFTNEPPTDWIMLPPLLHFLVVVVKSWNSFSMTSKKCCFQKFAAADYSLPSLPGNHFAELLKLVALCLSIDCSILFKDDCLLVCRSGSGKSSAMRHSVWYLANAYPAQGSKLTPERLDAAFDVLHLFGSCRYTKS